MKYLFIFFAMLSLLSFAMDEKGRLNKDQIEELRKKSCEAALYKILINTRFQDDLLMSQTRNGSEKNIYLAFEFILKHCSYSTTLEK